MSDRERDRVRVDDEADLAVDVALDALAPEDLARVEREVAEAGPAARSRFEAEVAGHRQTLAEVTEDVAADPPPRLRERILAATAQELRASLPPTPVPARERTGRGRSRGLRVLAAAAAVAVLFGSGLAVGRLTAPDPGPALAEREAGGRIRGLLTADDLRMQQERLADGGEVSVMYAPSVRMGAVLVTGMHDLPPGHHLAVWHADPGASARMAGSMGGPDSDAPNSTMLFALDAGDTLMLTVEESAAPAPSEHSAATMLAEIDLR